MINSGLLISVTIIYILSLFVIAFLTEKIYPKKPELINNPYVYTLTLAVYCTSWTFYGSVGQAATHGIDFITIYIGPTLIIFTWWFLLKKIVRISENHQINSVADFVSFRYGKSKSIGILVTLVCFFGIVPYIALQLKALNETASILTGIASHTSQNFYGDASFYVAILIGVLGSIFGTIHFGEKRKHPGIVGVIAYESLIKLVIFLIAGFIITFIIFDGFFDILNQISDSPYRLIQEKFQSLITASEDSGSTSKWFSLTFMSMMAVMFLPRQFHMAVVENLNENHIPKMMYLFPLYLFIINIFVIPIAFAGIITFNDTGNPDYYSLSILTENHYYTLGIIVYIGGIAASTGMIFISSVSLANMFINNILLPLSVKLFVSRNIGNMILHFKRLAIILIMIASYFYYYGIGESFSLVNIGLASFSAITIFSPQILFGLFWKRANAKGAFFGILSGFIVWFYTTVIPYATEAKVLSDSILNNGLCGIGILKPTQLFGITGLDFWSHSLFWSLLFNLVIFFSLSFFTQTNQTEDETADICLNILNLKELSAQQKSITGISIDQFIHILNNFFGEVYAKEKIYDYLEDIGKTEKELTSFDLADIKKYTEKCLSEAVGPGAAKLVIDSYLNMLGTGEEQVIDVFGDLLSYGVGESKDTLVKRLTELNVLLEISKIFGSQKSLQDKMQQVIVLLKETFKFDEVILREKEDNHLLIIATTDNIRGKPIDESRTIKPDNSYINKAVFEHRQYAVNDISTIDLNQYSAFLKDQGVVSFCHTPLMIDDQLIGIMSTFSKLHKDIFSTEFMNILQTIANQIAFSLRNQRQNDELFKMTALAKEMEIAEGIMKTLLPEQSPDIPKLDISGSCIPSKYVGGDYYDYFVTKEHRTDVIIADVSGHNIASALIMTEVRSLLKNIISSEDCDCPAIIVRKLLNEISPDLHKLEFIITLFYMRIDLENNRIIYTNAGHNPPVLIQNNQLIELSGGGPLLGIIDDIEYTHHELPFHTGDIIYLYTDGVTETENEQNFQFGTNQLYEILKKHSESSAKQIQDDIIETISTFRGDALQNDDITMVVIKKTED